MKKQKTMLMNEKKVFRQCIFCKIFKTDDDIKFWEASKFQGWVCIKCIDKALKIIEGEDNEKNNYKDS